jgi:hypothetical protein
MHIKENSWHWRVYSYITSVSYSDYQRRIRLYGDDYSLNFCKYARAVSFGVAVAFFLATAAALILFSIGAFWYDLYAYGIAFLGNQTPSGIEVAGVAGMIMQIFGAIGLLIFGIKRAIDSYNARRDRKPYPGFIATWYASHKHKFCPTVTLDPEPAI